MKRRDFIVASGSTVLSEVVASRIQRPAIGLDFEISTPDKDPSKVDSLLIEFETLKITPRYLDEKEPVSVQAKVEVNERVEKSNEVQTSVVNGGTKNLENNIDSIVVDGLNTSSTISGDVTVSIDHPDIQDSYSRQFNVNSSEIPDSGISRWGFDDNSDTTTAGDSWNTNNGRINGASYVSGYQGSNALDFDGTDDNVSLPSFSQFSSYAVSLWINPDGFNSGDIENYFHFGANNDAQLYDRSDGSVTLAQYNSSDNAIITQASALTDGTWEHIVAQWDGSQIELYLNGSFESSTSISSINSRVTSDNIGSLDGSRRHTDGQINDVRIYDKALSSVEVSNLYNDGSINR